MNDIMDIKEYKYLRLDADKIVVGIHQSTIYEPNRTDIMLIPDDYPFLDTIGLGWRLGNKNEWIPPEPPSEEDTLNEEIGDISSQLKALHKREEYLNYLGLDPESEEAETLSPYPEPRVREVKKHETLRTLFARLAGEPVSEPEVLTVKMESFSIQDKPTKETLLASLKEKQARLAAISSIK